MSDPVNGDELPPGQLVVAPTTFGVSHTWSRDDELGAPDIVLVTIQSADRGGVTLMLGPDDAERLALRITEHVAHCRPGDRASEEFLAKRERAKP